MDKTDQAIEKIYSSRENAQKSTGPQKDRGFRSNNWSLLHSEADARTVLEVAGQVLNRYRSLITVYRKQYLPF